MLCDVKKGGAAIVLQAQNYKQIYVCIIGELQSILHVILLVLWQAPQKCEFISWEHQTKDGIDSLFITDA